MGLVPDHGDVVEGDPLVPLVGVGPDGAGGVVDHLPALVVDLVADLVVGEESPGTSVLTRVPSLSGGVQSVLSWVGEREGLAVERDAQDQPGI